MISGSERVTNVTGAKNGVPVNNANQEILRHILILVNEWLRFAETKNGALFAADIAMIFGVVKVLGDYKNLPTLAWLYLVIASLCLLCSAITCLTSFVPRIKIIGLTGSKRPEDTDNLLYYAHIAQYDPSTFLKTLCVRYGNSNYENCTQLEKAYSEQIVANSKIANMKYELFGLAVWFTLSALVTPILGSVFWFLRKRG